MVHDVQLQAFQIGNISRNVEREYLRMAMRGCLGPKAEAFHNQTAFRRFVSIPHDRLVRRVAPNAVGQRSNRADVLIIQRRDRSESPDQRF
jgi:hypothetical protein